MCEDCEKLIKNLDPQLRERICEQSVKFLQAMREIASPVIEGEEPTHEEYKDEIAIIAGAYLVGFLTGNVSLNDDRTVSLIDSTNLAFLNGQKVGWAFRHTAKKLN